MKLIQRRDFEMPPFAATNLMDRIGMTLVNAILLAGLPTAVVAIILQAL